MTAQRRHGELPVQDLTEQHLAGFGDILKDSVHPDLGRFLVDNQHGYLDFLRLVVRFPESFPHHRPRVVAAPDGRPVAFADFRVHPPDTGFLSSLVVFPEFRGRGLAKRLLRRFADEFPGVGTLGLDVFADNTAAIDLYASSGFVAVSTHHWLVRGVRPGARRVAVTDLPRALGMHAAHGFTSFSVEGEERHGLVGLIGDEVINCFEESAFRDADFLSAVAGTFAGRRTAFHSTQDERLVDEPDVTLVNRSVRMELTDLSGLRT